MLAETLAERLLLETRFWSPEAAQRFTALIHKPLSSNLKSGNSDHYLRKKKNGSLIFEFFNFGLVLLCRRRCVQAANVEVGRLVESASKLRDLSQDLGPDLSVQT